MGGVVNNHNIGKDPKILSPPDVIFTEEVEITTIAIIGSTPSWLWFIF